MQMMNKILTARHETQVRFSEVDSMTVVWHGNYVKYFEDGREEFGSQFGLHYLDVYANELMTPVVKLSIDYKKPLNYGDTAIIETTYKNCDSAKIIFEYKIYRKSDGELAVTGESVQVFLNLKGELLLTLPPFMEEWKKKNGFLENK